MIRPIIIGFMMLVPFVGMAQQPDLKTIERIKEGVGQAAQQTETIISDFIQVKDLSMLDDQLHSSGKFYFKKRQNLRWEYTHPFSYIIVLQEDKVSIRDDKKTNTIQTANNPVFQEINRIIIGSVRGTLLDDPDFAVVYDGNKEYYKISLIPTQSHLKEILDKIILYFNRNTFLVDKLQMVENGGDQTTITFIKKRINQPIDDELFIIH
jgi:outer membrane lipoprotein-sorting protein